MASVQCHKPSEQINNQVQSSTYHQKTTTTETRHNKNHNTNTNEHSFTEKVKEMAHSARKMFNHQEHEGHDPVPNHAQKPTSSCSSGTAHCGVKTEKKKKKKMVKKTEGYDGHCMPKMLDHVKNMKKKVKKNKEEKHGASSNDSGSSSESDNETTKKKVT